MKINPAYKPPVVTVDMVCFAIQNKQLNVLLIARQNLPFKGMSALPGGYMAQDETSQGAIGRILKTKAKVSLSELSFYEQFFTFDSVARDPRGRAVSIAFLGLANYFEVSNSQVFWAPVKNLPKLAFDHNEVIKIALKTLVTRLNHSNIAYSLLPAQFTLTELQEVYEAAYDKKLDKRNFRKKILSLGLIKATPSMQTGTKHRPARLYCFKNKQIHNFESPFLKA